MIEIIIAIALFILCFLLIRYRFYLSLIVGLILSMFLHKELFSIYMWDLLPIRIFMSAFLLSSFIDFWKFNKISLRFVSYLKDPFIALNILLIITKLISTVNTLSLSSTIFLNIFFINISVFLITVYLRLKDTEILDLLKKYVSISVLMALITFVQLYFYFQYSYLFGAILNVAGRSVDIPSFDFSYSYFTELLKIIVMTRVGSLFWDVNHFGGFIASTTVLSFAFLVNSKDRRSFWINLFSFLVLGLVLFLTNSRSAWVLAFVSFLVLFTCLIYRKVGKKGIIYSLIGVTILSTFLVFQYQDRDSLFREKVRSYFHYRLDSFDSHFLLLRGTVNVFDKYQLIGGGVGSFFEHFKSTETADEFLRRDPAGLSVKVPAHTIWGEVLSETGIVGLTVFILFIALLVSTSLYSVIHTKGDDFIYSSSVFGLTIGWMVAGIFYSYNSEFFYLCLVLPFFYLYKKVNLDLNQLLNYFNSKAVYSFLILLGISSYLVFYQLGTNKFIPFDEAIYAKVASNMYESGDLFTLRWNPETFWFEKPPLYFIVTSFFYNVFGENEFSARLFSALSSLVLVIFVYKFAKMVFDSSKSGYFAVIALITNVSILYYSRMAMLDVIFTTFIFISTYFFIKNQKDPKVFNLILTGIFVGLAVMTKNIVGLLPLGFFGVYYLIRLIKDKSTFFTSFKSFGLIFLTVLIVSLPWHLHMYNLYGDRFINSYFGYHLFERFGTVIEEKEGPWNFYLLVIQNSMRIWFGALLIGLVYFIYKIIKTKENENLLFVLYSSLIVLLVFSISSSKLRWYIMPIYPFLSLIAGYFVAEFVNYFNKYFKKPILTFLLSFGILVFSFYYLYLVRNMVYTSDLTGRMIEMLLINNTQKVNKAEIVFVDKVDYPLILYYSEVPFQPVLFSSLRSNLSRYRQDNKNATFITSQSRFLDIQRLIPEVTKISENKDFVLGSLKLD